MTDRRAAFLDGTTTVAPVLLGVAPFGLIAGATAVQAGIDPVLAVAMSVIVFAGASQLAVVELVDGGAPALVLVATAAVVNLRMVMYSASIAPYFRPFSVAWRTLMGVIMTDQSYALSLTRYESEDPIAGVRDDPGARKWFYLGASLTLWVVWQVTTVLGAVLGGGLPPEWSLGFAVPLTFMALLVPAVEDSPTLAAAVVGATLSIVGAGLPNNAGLLVGAVCGVGAGLLVERRTGTDDWGENDGDDVEVGA
jgi:predicted branched-subunit amino acid permease